MHERHQMEINLFGEVIVPEEEIDVKIIKKSPFDYTKDIGDKTYPEDFKDYNPWLTNSSFSQRKDTVLYANEMNRYYELSSKTQFDFYYHALPKKKYFAKWAKAVKSEYTESIMWYFDVSYKVAKQYEKVLKKEQMDTIKDKYNNRKGGK